MKTKAEQRRELIKEINLMAKRIVLETTAKETIFISGFDYEKKIMACATKISELQEKIKNLEN